MLPVLKICYMNTGQFRESTFEIIWDLFNQLG